MPARDQDTVAGELDARAWRRLDQLATDLDKESIESVSKLLALTQEKRKSRFNAWQSGFRW